MSSWFGQPWPSAELPAPVCADPSLRVATPVGQACPLCRHPVDVADRGTLMAARGMDGRTTIEPVHRECSLREALGCSAHLHGAPHDHDRDLREDAVAVLAWLEGHPGAVR